MEPDQTFVDHRGKEHPLLPPTDDMLYDGERIPLHRDLQQVLKDYTKAVMAERPTNVAEWSAEYFAVRARESARQGSPSAALLRSAPPQFRRLPVEVQDRVCDVFLAYDRDKSGFINKQEFWTMLKEVRGAACRHRPVHRAPGRRARV